MNALVDSLGLVGIDAVVIDKVASNISEKVLIVENYAPASEEERVCIALPLVNYPDSPTFAPKVWINVDESKVRFDKIARVGPQPHPDYNKFCHNGVVYYPYSVGLGEYSCEPKSIKSLLIHMYGHINF